MPRHGHTPRKNRKHNRGHRMHKKRKSVRHRTQNKGD